MKAIRGLWTDFVSSYDAGRVLAMSEPRSLASAVLLMFVVLVVPAFIPTLARHGGIDHHWLAFGLFVAGVCSLWGFSRVQGRAPWGSVFAAGSVLLSQTALTLAVLTTSHEVRAAYGVLQGVSLLAIHARCYALTLVFAVLLSIPLIGMVSQGVAYFGMGLETLLMGAGTYLLALWVSNLTRIEREATAKSAELRDALIASETVADRSLDLAMTRTALTVGDTLHELKNHLFLMGTGLEYLRETIDDDPNRRAALSDTVSGYEQARSVLETMIGKLRRTREQVDATFDPADTIKAFAAGLKLPGVTVRVEGDSGPFEAQGDEDGFRTVLRNLARNGVRAGARGIRLVHRVEQAGKSMRVEVWDDGGGIDERVAGDLFKPFVTGKEAEGGTGLGLYLSRRHIELMGGSLEVSSSTGTATCFTILLPGRAGSERRREQPS